MSRKYSPHHGNADGLMAAAQWLSGVFIAPLSTQQVIDASAEPALDLLRGFGKQLGAEASVNRLCQLLEQDRPENLAVHLQRRYTVLFEGIFRHRAVLPYEGAWHQEGPAFGGPSVADMNAILRALDVHISADCCEPADHLAIELAALVAALGSSQNTLAAELVQRLQSWVPAFTDALKREDTNGFYAAAGELLLSLLRTAHLALLATEPESVPVHGQRQGEFA
ncbi:TorD/DmsD family molecular chaperone [Marinobacter sp. VGCF2001]|uniref:TorD/DmsD family molecular chaperone n=1 Tax=Marinobacter sp. VGCF2001 TaxID=3417189 RepID=UPI003CF47B30